jgi:hypothetical protein
VESVSVIVTHKDVEAKVFRHRVGNILKYRAALLHKNRAWVVLRNLLVTRNMGSFDILCFVNPRIVEKEKKVD